MHTYLLTNTTIYSMKNTEQQYKIYYYLVRDFFPDDHEKGKSKLFFILQFGNTRRVIFSTYYDQLYHIRDII